MNGIEREDESWMNNIDEGMFDGEEKIKKSRKQKRSEKKRRADLQVVVTEAVEDGGSKVEEEKDN